MIKNKLSFLCVVFFLPLLLGAESESFAPAASGPSHHKAVQNPSSFKEGSEVVYHLSIDYKDINFNGVKTKAMAVNQSLPAPTLYFKEGQKAIIYVKNNMDVETSIHWHGILLPNFEDGVPYLTSPPIGPGQTHKFEFFLRQSGTYWYHSHTGLQEQKGVYGAIVIEPEEKHLKYDYDLVLVLSDWTNEDPYEVLRSLKRGSEWYAVKKGADQSFFKVLRSGALLAQLKMWWQRMPGMDISDVYYDTFLVNGQPEQNYPQFKAGEKIRLRVVNAAASTYFWLTFGKKTLLISADGMDVHPVKVNKVLHAIAETYDFLLTVPEGKAFQFKATAQDGSGFVSAVMGQGDLLKAPVVPRPDLMEEMKKHALHHGGGGHHMSHHGEKHTSKNQKHPQPPLPHKAQHTHHHYHQNHLHPKNKAASHHLHHKEPSALKEGEDLNTLRYGDLKALKKTAFPSGAKVKEMVFDLVGNMRRYVWSINGKTLSESEKIPVKKGEVLRITLNNTTMMHHPMHLHGHFFRVLSPLGVYSPLKHTVDVPPHEKVVIEFMADEEGDWFFHCHVLYHMKQGMSRVFASGDFKRDERMKNYSVSPVWNTDRHWFKWGQLSLMTHQGELHLTSANHKNQWEGEVSVNWVDSAYKPQSAYEGELSYQRFVTDNFRLWAGVEVHNKSASSWRGFFNNSLQKGASQANPKKEKFKTFLFGKKPGIYVGIKYLLPFLVDAELSLSSHGELALGWDYDLHILPRWELFFEGELVKSLKGHSRKELCFEGSSQHKEELKNFPIKGGKNLSSQKQSGFCGVKTDRKEIDEKRNWHYEWSLGGRFTLSQRWFLLAHYEHHKAWGVGLAHQF